MKILKAKVTKRRTDKSCHFEYPNTWDASKIHVLAWGPGKGLGVHIEDCLCIAEDAIAEALIAAGEATEISKPKANALGRAWRPQSFNVTDPDRVSVIAEKIVKSSSISALLSQKEIDALNPDSNAPGIARGQRFRIDDFF